MQGESDADSGRAPDGKTMDCCEIVQAGQAKFVEQDPRAALIDATQDYKFSDDWHYDTAAYIDLGQQFAGALRKLAQIGGADYGPSRCRRTCLCPCSVIDSRAACRDSRARYDVVRTQPTVTVNRLPTPPAGASSR